MKIQVTKNRGTSRRWLVLLVFFCGASCGLDHRERAACVVRRPAALTATEIPTRRELIGLITDATQHLQAAGDDGASVERVRSRLTRLARSVESGDAAASCRALRAARVALLRIPDEPSLATERSAITLVLDLAAATLASQPSATALRR